MSSLQSLSDRAPVACILVSCPALASPEIVLCVLVQCSASTHERASITRISAAEWTAGRSPTFRLSILRLRRPCRKRLQFLERVAETRRPDREVIRQRLDQAVPILYCAYMRSRSLI